ncbi:EAL domain-containing protein [Thermomicrobium sp. 4228-Ro]|uniref:bifunctional diguanylate cyclase/phosphodiesterase n=1 Tax=Thermomicrobium sp. 4228-Ro TaxID=2993937 RepID=UPI002248B537|nr:EAL domain-containing protein [Thermomicrobium sp. 4228-Ro]MCX2726965.1 EAL domain-containing protein [Thermomicrobium sp. 4228-Ro]
MENSAESSLPASVAAGTSAEQEIATRLVALAQVALILNRETDFNRALARVLPLLVEAFGAAAGWITMRVGDTFELVATTALPPGLAADNQQELRWFPCRCQRLALSGELTETAVVIACERLARLHERSADPAVTGGLTYHLSVPLRQPNGKVLGLLNLAYRSTSHLTESEKTLLNLVGQLLASALERALLAEEVARLHAAERTQALRLAQRLMSQRSVVAVADTVFAALEPILRPDAQSLLTVDPTGRFLVLRAGRGWSADRVGRLWLPLEPPSHNGPAWALHVGHAFALRLDHLARPFHVPEPVLQAGVKFSAFFPLYSGEQPVGVVVANFFEVRELSEEQLRFAELLCGIGALAIARALEQEQSEALISELPVGVFQANGQGAIQRANRALARLLGWERSEELEGRVLDDFFVERVEARRLFGILQRGDVLAGGEYRWLRRDGRPIWVRVSARPVLGPGGQLLLVEGVVEDVSDRKSVEEHLAYLARHDSLTGIANRHTLFDALQERIARSMRRGQSGALVLLDLDNFKLVNDQLGHAAGDSVLRAVANRLVSVLRTGELVARLGGDEFAAVLYPVTREAAERIAARLLSAIAQVTVSLPSRMLRLGASCGVALFPEHGVTVEEVLIAADRALYTAKYSGRGRVQVYEASRSSHERAVTMPVEFLESVLASERLILFAQPILDLHTARVVGYELLLRLREGERVVDPDMFLPLAERLNLMPRLDLWVVEQLVQSAHVHHGRVHVNLSAQTLRDVDSFRPLGELLERIPFPAGRLVFEVTESAALTDLVWARERLQALRDRGCLIALDDFGVGYSSFYQLRSLPFDFLKIDGNLIVDLASDGVNRSIVRAIVELARALGARTIAEWVEQEDLLPLLGDLGVDEAQGYAIGSPQPLDAL